MPIPASDLMFLNKKVLPYFRLRRVDIAESDYKGKWPDLWVDTSRTPPIIVVTREWRRQSVGERRKRLVHEVLHLAGLEHPENGGTKIGGLVYHTRPVKDTFSRLVYQYILAGNIRWRPKEFGL